MKSFYFSSLLFFLNIFVYGLSNVIYYYEFSYENILMILLKTLGIMIIISPLIFIVSWIIRKYYLHLLGSPYFLFMTTVISILSGFFGITPLLPIIAIFMAN